MTWNEVTMERSDRNKIRVNEREPAIRQFVIEKNILMSVFNASVLFDHEFRHNIVKVVCGSTRLSPRGSTATLTIL